MGGGELAVHTGYTRTPNPEQNYAPRFLVQHLADIVTFDFRVPLLRRASSHSHDAAAMEFGDDVMRNTEHSAPQ